MEDTTDVTPVVTEPTSTEQSIVSFIGEDGTFKEGWRDHVPEDIRADKVFDRAVSLEGVFKSLASAERKFGMESIPLPSESSTPEDWEAFHKALGRLDKPEDYKFDKPEGVGDELWPKGIAEMFQAAFFEAGTNPKQAEIFNGKFNEFWKAQIEKTALEGQLKYDEELGGLKTEWSGAWDSNIHLGNIALEKGTDGDPELKERIKKKFGPDPDFARFSKNLGANFTEGKIVDSEATPITTSDVEGRLRELMTSDAFMNKMNPGHKAALEKQRKLLVQKASIK